MTKPNASNTIIDNILYLTRVCNILSKCYVLTLNSTTTKMTFLIQLGHKLMLLFLLLLIIKLCDNKWHHNNNHLNFVWIYNTYVHLKYLDQMRQAGLQTLDSKNCCPKILQHWLIVNYFHCSTHKSCSINLCLTEIHLQQTYQGKYWQNHCN